MTHYAAIISGSVTVAMQVCVMHVSWFCSLQIKLPMQPLDNGIAIIAMCCGS